MGMRPVVGTSGVSPAEATSLHELALTLGLGGAVVPNFSVGMLALSLAAKAANGRLPSGRIVEAHHQEKADAPSGTAIQLADELGLERSQSPIQSELGLGHAQLRNGELRHRRHLHVG